MNLIIFVFYREEQKSQSKSKQPDLIFTFLDKKIESGTQGCCFQNFEQKIYSFITKTIPEIYQLLRTNKVKNAEDIIIDELHVYMKLAGQNQKATKVASKT